MSEPHDTKTIYTKQAGGLVIEARLRNVAGSKWVVTEHYGGTAAPFRTTEHSTLESALGHVAAKGYDVDNPRTVTVPKKRSLGVQPSQASSTHRWDPVGDAIAASAAQGAAEQQRPLPRTYRHQKRPNLTQRAYWDTREQMWKMHNWGVGGPFASIEEMEAQLRAKGYDTDGVHEGMTADDVEQIMNPPRDIPWGRILIGIGFAIYWFVRANS